MIIRLEKLTELPDAKHPNNKEVGYTKEGTFIEAPKVGETFLVGMQFQTSIVNEIIDKNTFKTLNSTYKWEVIN